MMFSAEILKWVFWGIGTFGVVGAVVALVCFPTFFLVAVKAIGRFFALLIAYRIGCALIALVLGLAIADYWRAGVDAAEWDQRTAAFERAQAERDKQIEQDAKDQVWIEIANQTAANTVTDNQVKDFHDALPSVPPTSACDDIVHVGSNVDRLRVIAGSTVRRSIRPQRVPKARKKAAGA